MGDDEVYEAPHVEVLGEVTDLTQKFGIYFDFGHATQGQATQPGPGPGVTFS